MHLMRKSGLFLALFWGILCHAQDNPHGDNFNLDCENCHNPEDWKVNLTGISFDHSQTGYPLLGSHNKVSCRVCHQVLIFSNIGHQCADCHSDVHQGEFGNECNNCHSPQSWENRQESYEKHNQTQFPLLGIHALLDCESCHFKYQRRQFVQTAIECKGCHLETFIQTSNPAHARAGFDLNCENCHFPAALTWEQATYDHSSIFPLTGAHQDLQCNNCHSTIFAGTPTDCYPCHQTDYAGAVDPNHVINQFDHDCTVCHNSSAWEPASFDHASTSFPLTGAHVPLTCQQCHATGYTNTSTECFACHQQNYNGTTDPNHLVAHFPIQCNECHTTSAWQPANWNHDSQYFPIYSGKHNAQWNTCADCHTNPTNYADFSCLTCHEHNQTEMNDKHNEVPGYSYVSSNCYSCHPTGTSEGGGD